MSISEVLHIAAMLLNASAILFAVAYVRVNLMRDVTGLAERNKTTIRLCNSSMYMSLVATLLSCLFTDSDNVNAAMQQVGADFSLIIVCWLVVLSVSCLVLLLILMSKRFYRKEAETALQQVNKTAIKGAVLSLVLYWLFS